MEAQVHIHHVQLGFITSNWEHGTWWPDIGEGGPDGVPGRGAEASRGGHARHWRPLAWHMRISEPCVWVSGLGFMVCGLWFVVCVLWCRIYGSWFVVYALCFLLHGFWFMVYGLWLVVHGSWFMAYVLCFMFYGLWFMVYGLWFGFLGFVCGAHHVTGLIAFFG